MMSNTTTQLLSEREEMNQAPPCMYCGIPRDEPHADDCPTNREIPDSPFN